MKDLETYRHKEWLGYLQPVGLVVSSVALLEAGAIISSDVIDLQQTLNSLLITEEKSTITEILPKKRPRYRPTRPEEPSKKESTRVMDFLSLATEILGWQREDLENNPDQLIKYELYIRDYQELITPSYLVKDPENTEHPMMLVRCLKTGTSLDQLDTRTVWHATPTAKFERQLRETQVHTGILYNKRELRLLHAPAGEMSGHVTFNLEEMTTVAGRVILGALSLLLSADRLFNQAKGRNLIDILQNSRKYQSHVTTKLSQQVLSSLWELLKGWQTAQFNSQGLLLKEVTPEELYGGLITILLRLVFMLYAEDEGLMPKDKIYSRNYAVTGLYEKLERDAANYRDTLDTRYGAYAGLLSLFRLVYSGGGHLPNYLPARVGQLFDPDIYPFLEGRTANPTPYPIPLISDGVIYRILQGLMLLDGERLSYRVLDVEQIGSVYEAIMGYEVKISTAPSIGIWSKPSGSKTSLTIVINLEELLASNDRPEFLEETTGCKLTGNSLSALKIATNYDDLLAALGHKISSVTSYMMPTGSLYLQPTAQRRRSGSHYTPRSMTEPIVKESLRPILERLGESATEADILDIKVCDLAMGSGAFLVEACRQLAARLVQAWSFYKILPAPLTDDEDYLDEQYHRDNLLYARQKVAGRCLYGVDLNPFAVNLAKLSLWLVTSAKDYPFTFLDHALKCGDSLVGLSRSQIKAFTWIPQREGTALGGLFATGLPDGLVLARSLREEIYCLASEDYQGKLVLNNQADKALFDSKFRGNLIVDSFFAADNKKGRDEKRNEFLLYWDIYMKEKRSPRLTAPPLLMGEGGINSFHWSLEFPEVFDRPNQGFDVILGNPPFMGKNTLINAHSPGYSDWLKFVYPDGHGNADLVAFFFRRAFDLLRNDGTLGLIATNTISQGDTRSTGLRYIAQNGGTIYHALKRFKWPGLAAVVVSVVNIYKGIYSGVRLLDNKPVPLISAFLFHAGGNDDPKPLIANSNKSFQGSIVLGMGFTFVDARSPTSRRDDSNAATTSIEEMQRLIEKDARNKECIFPYIGGEEVNSHPTHAYHRYVINFGEMSEDEARSYPDLMSIVEEKVKPERDKLGNNADALRRKNKWWLWGRYTPALFKTIAPLERVLVIPCAATRYLGFTFLPNGIVYSNSLVVIASDKYSIFSILQSHIHEIWARFLGSSMKDDLRYTPSDCFETFPSPLNPSSTTKERGETEEGSILEEVGKTYYEYRASLMIKNKQGLTETYNRFHNPEERDPGILRLRTLHDEIDRAVLDAYGWTDIQPKCTFLLDYEEEEDSDNPSKRARKKPWRYRWPADIHDEVLARLLNLNEQRYMEEVLRGDKVEKKVKGSRRKTI